MIKLPRLPLGWKTQPQLFERYWDEAMKKLEETLNAILQIPIIQAALANKEDVGVAATTIAEHEAAANPHPQYLTETEADALYAPIGSGGGGGGSGTFMIDDGTASAGGTFTFDDGAA